MVEAIAVAAGTSGAGATTCTLGLGLALAEDYDVMLLDPAAGLTELFGGPAPSEGTLQDVFRAEGPSVDAVTYERHGVQLVPCGAPLNALETVDALQLQDVFTAIAADTDVLLIDSPALLASPAPTLPIVVADRTVVVIEPTLVGISDGLKVQEYAQTYGTEIAGILFNTVPDSGVDAQVIDYAEQYFEGPILGQVPESSAITAVTVDGPSQLSTAPAATAFRPSASQLTVQDGRPTTLGTRARQAIIPKRP